ncbi:hypothetical protein GCM10027275_46460 [Rhabdobacter roseus]|uniref:Acetyltransferase-like isoleucine patch superfamily enzyme n=1 Tax=Rhabdobacter roseus TaxID=1655419 RepID=A0A840TTT5_9BACT|nr:acyltransferase [Rhabdobacter roseus]MBB5286684.1 acetyltransferase-like isoleucine patch superfamily enzyme [Rhabdobacter roseus]
MKRLSFLNIYIKLVKSTLLFLKKYNTYARFCGVQIGNNCRIYIKDFGTEPFLITIGNKVTIASGVRLITHDGSTWLFNDVKGRRYHYRRISIGDNVFIGMNSIILPGVKIENNVIVGAGSVVTKSIPSGFVVGGNPAKIIMKYQDYEDKVILNYPSEDSMLSVNYKERVLNSMDNSFKSFITI